MGLTRRLTIFIKLLIVTSLLTVSNFTIEAQESVLNSLVSCKMSNVKISSILKSITRKTGYEFTYDTDLVKPDSLVNIFSNESSLSDLLDMIFGENVLSYTTIGNHIIIYREPDRERDIISEPGRDDVYQIGGIVRDKSSGEPLPFATIGIYLRGKGTVSNYEGRFSFKITEADLNDSIRVSYLGFNNQLIPVRAMIGLNYVIELERRYIPIQEIIIKIRDPLELIRNSTKNIGENYGSSPVLLTAFYRESISRRSHLQEYSEAVINIYKSPYARTIQSDQVKLYKSRKIVNTDISDTLVVKLKAGLDACLRLDGIKNPFDFIREENLSDYDYRLVDIVSFDDEAAFVIEFSQKEYITDIPLFMGLIYINTDNYGIHAVEFEINEKYIDNIDDQFVPKSSNRFIIKVKKVKYKVEYKYLEGRYYLNHVRGDLEFYARKRKSLFGSPYFIFFEMATTDIDTINIARFNRSDLVETQAVFSETITKYDPDFWGTDNFLKPEDQIQEAILRIRGKLDKFVQ